MHVHEILSYKYINIHAMQQTKFMSFSKFPIFLFNLSNFDDYPKFDFTIIWYRHRPFPLAVTDVIFFVLSYFCFCFSL